MKSLFSVLALAVALGFSAGCGPQEAFCPNTGVDGGPVCPINGDDASMTGKDMNTNICPPGQHLGDNPDGDGNLVCVSN